MLCAPCATVKMLFVSHNVSIGEFLNSLLVSTSGLRAGLLLTLLAVLQGSAGLSCWPPAAEDGCVVLGAAGPGRVLSPLTSARVTQKSWAVLQTAFFWPKISSTTFFFSFFSFAVV